MNKQDMIQSKLDESTQNSAENGAVEVKGDKDIKQNSESRRVLFVRGIPLDVEDKELEAFFSEAGPIKKCFIVREKALREQETDDISKNKADMELDEAASGDSDSESIERLKKLQNQKKMRLKKKEESGEKEETLRKSKGFGFIHFVLEEDAQRAVREYGSRPFRGTTYLKVELALRKGESIITEKIKTNIKARVDKKKAKAEEKNKKSFDSKKKHSEKLNTVIIKGIKAGISEKELRHKVRKAGEVQQILYKPFDNSKEGNDVKDAKAKKGEAVVVYSDNRHAKRAIEMFNNHVYKGEVITIELKKPENNKNARLIIRNLPFKFREKDILREFGRYGKVEHVDLGRKYVGGPLKGYAFVQMDGVEAAKAALENINGKEYLERVVAVDWAIPKDEFEKIKNESSVNDNNDEEDEEKDENEEDGEEDQEEGSEEEDEEEEKEEEKENQRDDDAEIQKSTLFIKNVSYTTEEDELYEKFREFGKIRYVRLVVDRITNKPRGTAFVSFWDLQDAKNCYEAAKKAFEITQKSTGDVAQNNAENSVLITEAPKSLEPVSKFVVGNRQLMVEWAVSREQAQEIQEKRAATNIDKRNLYLLKEGVIFPSESGENQSDISSELLDTNLKNYGKRKAQLTKNPNLFVSKTRLCIRNIPPSASQQSLKQVAMSSIDKFKANVRAGKVLDLTSEEKITGNWSKRPKIVQAKLILSSKSKPGYAFVEFAEHSHALACLRYLNFLPTKLAFNTDSSSSKMLFVEFAIENNLILLKRKRRITAASEPSTDENRIPLSEAPPSTMEKNDNILFSDIFEVKDVDKDGKKFDRVSRIDARSDNYDMELTLDINSELYSLGYGDKFTLLLASTLTLPSAASNTASSYMGSKSSGTIAGSSGIASNAGANKADAMNWRAIVNNTVRSIADDFEYVMYGKIYRYDDSAGTKV
ncbi:putative RNA-binding protein [Zancudomyces culisetae]|uniref:Putative RNA-binding protein n=1 Tax=Zancudomyces culisetae TaxID=1213189 RepID=A0A1R1PZ89_ZANCU|nr:putative RNA-binding protein [Zancudomyces culisetae]|eukprot:OMH86265.1 putative RNA-binding protein [Zancudomyces culisetae]